VGLETIATAKVILGPRMVTAQEVRAVKGSLIGYEVLPQCSDGVDNDGDGAIDYDDGNGDPDCDSDADTDESS